MLMICIYIGDRNLQRNNPIQEIVDNRETNHVYRRQETIEKQPNTGDSRQQRNKPCIQEIGDYRETNQVNRRQETIEKRTNYIGDRGLQRIKPSIQEIGDYRETN